MQDCVQLKNDIDVIRKNKDIAIKNKICRINELEKELRRIKYVSLYILKKFKWLQSCDIVVRFKNTWLSQRLEQEAKKMIGAC